MQYTEEHYAEMYNNLPEGLKDLVLSGRLAILVSAIGSRHGLNADQVAELEPAVEDVCLGLITKDQLAENIIKATGVDQRVGNRIAAEAELEILNPFDPELVIARKQKEDLDKKINGGKPQATAAATSTTTTTTTTTAPAPKPVVPMSKPVEPQNVSGHAQIKKVEDWFGSKDSSGQSVAAPKNTSVKSSFDWDKDFGKKDTPVEMPTQTATTVTEEVVPNSLQSPNNLENKLDVLTESINKLVNSRFGVADTGTNKADDISAQLKELTKRLERAERENEEHKKLIKNLQGVKPLESIFGTPQPNNQNKNSGQNNSNSQNQNQKPNKSEQQIKIDKERKVDIAKNEENRDRDGGNKKRPDQIPNLSGNVQVTSVSSAIPIQKKTDLADSPVISSTVSADTLDSIVETRVKEEANIKPQETTTSAKQGLTLDELINKSDSKIKDAQQPKTATLVFPGVNEEKKIDVKNISQKDSLRQTLLEDLEFLKNEGVKSEKVEDAPVNYDTQPAITNLVHAQPTTTFETNPFKEELMPKTKEERMQALQDKIKALNKGVSSGGKTNITNGATSGGVDPYKL